MKTRLHLFKTIVSALVLAAFMLPAANAQSTPTPYPGTGRITIVVPFAPGGATDIIARLLQAWGNCHAEAAMMPGQNSSYASPQWIEFPIHLFVQAP